MPNNFFSSSSSGIMLVEALHAIQPEVPRNVYVISDEVDAAIADLEEIVQLLGSVKH